MTKRSAMIFKIDKRAMAEKGQTLYQTIKDTLEPQHNGEIVAIEVDSGDYYLGRSVIEADNQARKKHPDKLFYFTRVGRRALHVFH